MSKALGVTLVAVLVLGISGAAMAWWGGPGMGYGYGPGMMGYGPQGQGGGWGPGWMMGPRRGMRSCATNIRGMCASWRTSWSGWSSSAEAR